MRRLKLFKQAKHMRAESIPTKIWMNIKTNVMSTRIGIAIASTVSLAATLMTASPALAEENQIQNTADSLTTEQTVDVNTQTNDIPVVTESVVETPVVSQAAVIDAVVPTVEEAPVVAESVVETPVVSQAAVTDAAVPTVEETPAVDYSTMTPDKPTPIYVDETVNQVENNAEQMTTNEQTTTEEVVAPISQNEEGQVIVNEGVPETTEGIQEINEEVSQQYGEGNDVIVNNQTPTNEVVSPVQETPQVNDQVTPVEGMSQVNENVQDAATNNKVVVLYDIQTGKPILTTEGTIGLNNEQWEKFINEHPEYKDAERYPYNYFLDGNGNIDATKYRRDKEFENNDLNQVETQLGNKPTVTPPTPTPEPEPTPPAPTPVTPTPPAPTPVTPTPPTPTPVTPVNPQQPVVQPSLPQTSDPTIAAQGIAAAGMAALGAAAATRKKREDEEENSVAPVQGEVKQVDTSRVNEQDVDAIMNDIYARTGIEAPKHLAPEKAEEYVNLVNAKQEVESLFDESNPINTNSRGTI